MDYPGFCAKFGVASTIGLSMAFGAAANGCIEVLANNSEALFESAALGANFGYFGWCAGVFAHLSANKYCSNKGYGISKGSGFVKKIQAASYAAVLTTSLGLSHAGQVENENTDQKQKDQDTTLQIKEPQADLTNISKQRSLTMSI